MNLLFCATHTKAGPWLDALRSALPHATVTEWQPGAPPADHAVVWSPPQRFFDEQPGLRGIFNLGAGVDALLQLRLPPTGQVVRIDDGGMAVQMAEYVCHAAIRHFREFDAYERDVGEGRWSFRRPRLRGDFPVGILGLGVLGTRVAQALAQFEFPLRGWSRTDKRIDGMRCFAGDAQLGDFLAGTRILVNLLPLTPATAGILNRATLSQLLPDAYVINAARGAHLVEADLLALVDEGRLAGAALDVFATEPLPAGHPFWSHPRIAVTPHTAARTLREETIAQIAAKLPALDRGERVTGLVDPARGY